MGLYAVAKQRSSLRWLIICAVTAFVVYTASWAKPYSVLSTIWSALYSATFVIAPIGLGLLMRARVEISSKLAEIERVRRHEQQLLIERALARQRAELAREMHDVVSHQVSLIAVQAGALQVTARDDAAAHTARTIRALSVQTLDELRHMVGVLRTAAGDRTDQPQQPGLDNIDTLVATSGVPAVISARLDNDIIPSPAVQHVLYRTVQEGLTNITKHAPGATATLEFHIDFDQVSLKLTNSKPDRSPDRLPGARYGLLGLRERAAQLGGTLRAGPLDDGGFELSLTLPTHI
jgi:signal transduction histidine kinase